MQSYEAPYEDTDTLVLTSPGSVFVDVRFPIKRELGKPIESDPAFWAFSGITTTTFIEGESVSMPYSAHCIWKHNVDSHGPGGGDEGDMFLLPNGDSMEVGMMENPASSKVEMYKEYWTGPPVSKSSNDIGKVRLAPCIVAKRVEPGDHEAHKPDVPNESGGTIIRIGNYCQGVMHQPPAGTENASIDARLVLVERWTKAIREDQSSSVTSAAVATNSEAADWVQDWRSNTPSDTGVSMPCMWVCDNDRKLGDEIVVKDITWRIVEAVLEQGVGEEA